MRKHHVLQQGLYGLVLGASILSVPVQSANITTTTFIITGVLEAKTCSFSEASRVIDLPEIGTRSLTSGNAVSGLTRFTLALSCDSGISAVTITPSGTAVAGGDTTLFMNTGTARNVGLRLQDNAGNVLTPDGQRKATFNVNNAGGVYEFAAGYAGTGTGRVSGGSFQAVVTFALNYS